MPLSSHGAERAHDPDAALCRLGVPLTVVHDATRTDAWPAVEGLLMTCALLHCDGSQCHDAHGAVAADGDDLDELMRVSQTGQGPVVTTTHPDAEQVDWAALRSRAAASDDARLRAVATLRVATRNESKRRHQMTGAQERRDMSSLPNPLTRGATEPGRSPRPVVALDVDGVLNVPPAAPHTFVREAAEKLPGFNSYQVTLRGGVVASRFLRGGGTETINGTIWLNRLHGQWINTLLERGVEVAWCTTWETHANAVLAPLLDIPDLPLAVAYETDIEDARYRDRAIGSPTEWKREVLARRYPGRSIVWIDEAAEPLERDEATLPVFVDGQAGLGLAHMQWVSTWLTSIGW